MNSLRERIEKLKGIDSGTWIIKILTELRKTIAEGKKWKFDCSKCISVLNCEQGAKIYCKNKIIDKFLKELDSKESK